MYLIQSPLFEKNGTFPDTDLRSSLLDHLLVVQQRWNSSPSEQACALFRLADSHIWKTVHFPSGCQSSVNVDMKSLTKKILRDRGDAIILCHFHPDGSAEPSDADFRSTRMIAQFFRLLDVALLDHIIFGQDYYFSFREAGYL